MDVRRRRRVHRVRERDARPVRGDQGPHARAPRGLRASSTTARAWSCTSSSPTAPSGTARTRATPIPRRTVSYDFNTDEIGQVPERRGADLALDRRQRVPRRHVDFTRRNLEYVRRRGSTPTGTAGRRATATSSGRGMGEEKLDNSVYCIRGLYDLADMARSEGDGGARGAEDRADDAARPVRGHVVDRARRSPSTPTPSTIRRSAGRRLNSRTALDRRDADGGRADRRRRAPCPAWRRIDHGNAALALRETTATAASGRTTSGCSTPAAAAAGRRGRAHHLRAQHRDPGRRRGQLRPPRRRAAAALHRRRGRADVRRALHRRHAGRAAGRAAGDPAVAGLRRRRADTTRTSIAAGAAARCSCRPGATTARPGRWSTSSSACGPTSAAGGSRSSRSCLRRPPIAGEDIRLGGGAIDVSAGRTAAATARRSTPATRPSSELVIGHTLPRGSRVRSVTLDGERHSAHAARHEPGPRGHGRDRPGGAHAGRDGRLDGAEGRARARPSGFPCGFRPEPSILLVGYAAFQARRDLLAHRGPAGGDRRHRRGGRTPARAA